MSRLYYIQLQSMRSIRTIFTQTHYQTTDYHRTNFYDYRIKIALAQVLSKSHCPTKWVFYWSHMSHLRTHPSYLAKVYTSLTIFTSILRPVPHRQDAINKQIHQFFWIKINSQVFFENLLKKESFLVIDIFQKDQTSIWVPVFWKLQSSIASTFSNHYELVPPPPLWIKID